MLTHICSCSKLPVQNFDHGWRDIRTVRDPGGSVLHDELRVKCDRSHLVVKPYRVMTAKSKPLRIRRPKPLCVKLKINKGTYTYKSSQLAYFLFNLSDTNYIYHHKLPLCRRERFSPLSRRARYLGLSGRFPNVSYSNPRLIIFQGHHLLRFFQVLHLISEWTKDDQAACNR